MSKITQSPAHPPSTKTGGHRESRFRWLRRYWHTKQFAVFSVFLLAFFWWIPVIYTLNASIPPLELLNRSEGVLSFTGGTRRGSRVSLREDNGTKHKFACKVSAMANGTCGRREYAGKRAVVWWHPLETIEHAVQIEVDGKFILTYEWLLGQLASQKARTPWYAFGTTIFFLIIFIFIFKFERRRHEPHHD